MPYLLYQACRCHFLKCKREKVLQAAKEIKIINGYPCRIVYSCYACHVAITPGSRQWQVLILSDRFSIFIPLSRQVGSHTSRLTTDTFGRYIRKLPTIA